MSDQHSPTGEPRPTGSEREFAEKRHDVWDEAPPEPLNMAPQDAPHPIDVQAPPEPEPPPTESPAEPE